MKRKSQNKYKALLSTIVFSGGAFAINCLINLLLVPYISATLGTEAYGFASLAKNFANYALIISGTLNAFAARYIAVEYHKDNYEKANEYFASTFWGNLGLSTIILAISCVGIFYLEHIINIPTALIRDVKILFLFVFLNFFVTTVTVNYGAAGYIANRLDMANGFKILSYLGEIAVLLAFFYLFTPSIAFVGLGMLTASLVIALGGLWMSKRYTPELNVGRKYFNWRAIKDLVINGIWETVNATGSLLNNSLDLLICNLMLTAYMMGQLAYVKTIHTLFTSLAFLVGNAFQPMLLKSYAQGDEKVLRHELGLSMKLSGWTCNLLYAGFFALGIPFYRIWLPGQDIQFIYTLTLINNLMMIAVGPVRPLYYIYTLTVKKKVPAVITIIGGLCNVFSMYLLIRFTNAGLYAVVWTTVVVTCIINFITNPLYMAHVLGFHWSTFYPNILRNLVSIAVMIGVFKLIMMPVGTVTLPIFLGMGILLSIVGTLIHFGIVCNKEERQAIVRFAKRKLRIGK